MAQLEKNEILDIYLHEYDKVKDEQTQRIGFRDNMIYVNLVTIGAVASFGLTNPDRLYVFLLVPWICMVLGWTYLVNDQKISALGQYIRLDLEERLRPLAGAQEGELFGWEVTHRSDERRMERKVFKLIIDLIAFCLIGFAAVGLFVFQTPNRATFWSGVCIVEVILLVVLAYQIVVYADLKKGRK